MKKILNRVFLESGFRLVSDANDIQFFENSDPQHSSYYLVHYVLVNDLKGYFDNHKFDEVQEVFTLATENKSDIKKNTSLIVIVKSEELEADSQKFKNNVLQIEEDEFWFKKYVLIYSDNSLAIFRDSSPILEDLKSCMLNNVQFTSFKSDLFSSEEYYLVVQLFLKLPFLKVPVALNEQYLSISDILSNNLTTAQLALLEDVVGFDASLNDDYWASIKQASLTNEDSELLNQLFLRFKGND